MVDKFIFFPIVPASGIEQAKVRLGLDGAHGIDAIGLSGGIRMLWDTARVEVDILPHGNQAIHSFFKESHGTAPNH